MNRNFIILLIIMPLATFALSIFNIVFPLYLDYNKISISTIGLIFALPSIFYLVFRLFVGIEADIYGRKIFYSFGLFLGGLTKILFVFASSVWHFLFVKTLSELSRASNDAVDHIIIYEAVKKNKVGDSFGKLKGINNILGFFGTLIAGFLIILLGYANTIAFSGLVLFLGFLIFLKFREKKFKRIHYDNLSNIFDIRHLTRNMKIYTFSRFFRDTAEVMLIAFGVQLFLTKFLNASPLTLSITMGISTLFYGISSFFLGKLSDRFSPNKICFGIFILVGILTILMGLVQSVIFVSLIWILSGALMGITVSAMRKMINEYARSGFRGKDTNVSATIASTGDFIGPLIAGFLGSIFFPSVFVLSGMFSIISGILFMLIKN